MARNVIILMCSIRLCGILEMVKIINHHIRFLTYEMSMSMPMVQPLPRSCNFLLYTWTPKSKILQDFFWSREDPEPPRFRATKDVCKLCAWTRGGHISTKKMISTPPKSINYFQHWCICPSVHAHVFCGYKFQALELDGEGLQITNTTPVSVLDVTQCLTNGALINTSTYLLCIYTNTSPSIISGIMSRTD